MRSLMICTAHQILVIFGDKIKMNEMSGACSTYWGEETCMPVFGGETLGKETTWETQA
jgi:hypothetical protein